MASATKPPKKESFAQRASSTSPTTHPLTRYLLHLIALKRTNLCVSADVSTTAELLQLANDVGEHICVLKTHADIIDDWSERTVRGLQDASRRNMFLLFEDRKFGDIGNTLKAQYTQGPLRIAHWAHLVNAHLLPGPSIIPALREAALETLASLNRSVATTITSGSALDGGDGAVLAPGSVVVDESEPSTSKGKAKEQSSTAPPVSLNRETSTDSADGVIMFHHKTSRTNSLGQYETVTTISQSYEPNAQSPSDQSGTINPLSPQLGPQSSEGDAGMLRTLEDLRPPPTHALRGLLLLAQMSSQGSLTSLPGYTDACVNSARENKDFVCGFVCQEDITTQSHHDNGNDEEEFISFTPGVSLPPADSSDAVKGDGLGQQYRTPHDAIVGSGVDVVIVGRGILKAEDRAKEARRYRDAAWSAYEEAVR